MFRHDHHVHHVCLKKKGLEKASVSGYSVPLHCELRVALRSSHRPRVAPRAVLRVAIKEGETKRTTF